MLPDISKRRRLWGYELKDFDSRQIYVALEVKEHDGVTSPCAVEIIKNMNGYLEESRCLVVQASAVFLLMKDMLDGKLDDSGNELLKLYNEEIDRGLLGGALANVMKSIKSVAAQRRLVFKLKPVIKNNRINKDWNNLLTKFVDDIHKRLVYLREVIIPANLANTPVGAYCDYLESQGLSVYDDLALFIDGSGIMFEDDDKSCELYKEHVLEILKGLDAEATETLLQKAREGMAARRRRLEDVKRSVEEEKMNKLIKASEDCKATILAMCSTAGSQFRQIRAAGLRLRGIHHTEVWVVAAGRAKPRGTGWLWWANGKWGLTSVEKAKMFNTKKEADEAARQYKEQGNNFYAESAVVELASYGFCN